MKVPIHGIGVVAPDAVGIDAFRTLLRSGNTAIREVDRFDTNGLRATKAALVRDFKPRDFIHPMKMRRMNMLSRLAVAATKLAIDDCGATLDTSTGVAIGTSFGPVQTSVDYMQEYVEKGAALAPPQLFAESVANAPGSHIAIEWGLRGFNVTITQRESSALAAAMYASTQLVKENVRAALIGGVEEVNEMIFSVLDRIGALSPDVARPFHGDGISIGEGSAVFVAGAGTRKPYGSFAGFGIGRDTTASISDWGTGHEAVAKAMRAAIDDAELAPADIDAIYASANGSRKGDALEQRAIETLFGARAPDVIATKQIFGEYAAGGALQIAAALVALDEGKHRNVLVNALSAGGGIVCAVLST
jgi:3-oxoacyl-[acyl-carrier-protein] synthase II